MNLLAFDTSTEYLSVALSHGERHFQRAMLAGQQHSSLLLPWIAELLAEAGLELAQLDAIVYGNGPGAFTGLRIGAGVAQGLALGSGVPLLGIGSLPTLAEQSGGDQVLTVIDARMNEAYLAAWQRQVDGWWPLLAPQLVRADNAPTLPEGDWVGIGSGFALPWIAQRYPLAATPRHEAPDAVAMLRLAARQLEREGTHTSTQVELLYLRNQVAQTVAERAGT